MGIPELKISNQEPGAPLRGQLRDRASSKLLWWSGALLRSSRGVGPSLAVRMSYSQKFGLCSCPFGWGTGPGPGCWCFLWGTRQCPGYLGAGVPQLLTPHFVGPPAVCCFPQSLLCPLEPCSREAQPVVCGSCCFLAPLPPSGAPSPRHRPKETCGSWTFG